LVRFYDGHNGQNKLIDQLVAGLGDGDKNGFFTTRKELWVAELKGQVAGFYCLNYKRGGSVKLGPMITNPSLTGKGIGKAMMSHLLE
jgi:predicted GNAT family acetyltransferase